MNNLIQFRLPKSKPALPAEPAIVSNTPGPVRLFEGDVVLSKRPEYKKDNWQYLIKTTTGPERKSCKTSNLEKAKQIATDRYHEIQWLEKHGMTAKACTFKHAAEAYLEDAKYRATLGGKHSNLPMDTGIITLHLIPYFDKPISMITEADVRAYHVAYRAKWEATTGPGKFGPKAPTVTSMAYHEYLINKISAHAVEKKLIVANEVPQFRMTEATTKVRAGFTDDEMKRILKWMERRIQLERKHAGHAYARTMSYLYVWFLSLTGMRPGTEPLTIRYCDIEDRPNGETPHVVIKVRDGKTGPRSVLAEREVLEIVAKLKELHDSPNENCYIFNNPKQRRSANFSRMFGIVLDELGIENDPNGQLRSLYSIRHYFITKKILEGRNQALVAKNCGTSVEMISKHYAHLFVETQATALLGSS